MNYNLTNQTEEQAPASFWQSLTQITSLLKPHRKPFGIALGSALGNVVLTLVGPLIMAHVIDTYIVAKDFSGIIRWTGLLAIVYILAFASDYIQTSQLGKISQKVLFTLRNSIFTKLQDLPLSFFNQNKSGDLISRINNDTDKLGSFFSESLGWMLSNVVLILGSGVFMLVINPTLGLIALIPGLIIIISTRLTASWLRRKNSQALQATAQMSAEIQENLNNFKVIIAFNRQDYFQHKFDQVNTANYQANLQASIANTLLSPIYDMSANIAQVIVLVGGIYLILNGQLAVGTLIAYLAYVRAFYDPLREMASMWSNFQKALAAWDRIDYLLSLENDMTQATATVTSGAQSSAKLQFINVSFQYPDGKQALSDINFNLESGKTYALVGPTGGGKTTTASLMARLYDPTEGLVTLDGQDIRNLTPDQRTRKIGFILQEPFLFDGTLGQNLAYGQPEGDYSPQKLTAKLKKLHLDHLLDKFPDGLDTPITNGGESISLGQRQILAFIRAVLRQPEVLILDEATANVDSVTEQTLQEILDRLPASTTKIIIAHRLNTIDKADQIFFVNAGTITNAGSLKHALELLLNQHKTS